ncbi:hypothetical protein HIMB11_03069 [Rhodobacteraceae bacterium HIMB11]|nr:hypothetical protein HIMB11_03069 [Rhodobacteraceae bacterium HIMB11]
MFLKTSNLTNLEDHFNMNKKYQNYKQSRGELISSVAFFGVGIWFLLEALVYFAQSTLTAWLFILLSTLNFLAAFRFKIAKYYEQKANR